MVHAASTYRSIWTIWISHTIWNKRGKEEAKNPNENNPLIEMKTEVIRNAKSAMNLTLAKRSEALCITSYSGSQCSHRDKCFT